MPPRKARMADVPAGQYTPLSAAVTHRDASVLATVRNALDSGDVLLAYQPVMQARAPHGVAFYEGLIRVLDETRRVIPARDFIRAAENSDLGRKLDCQALRLGLRALDAHPDLRLSINMSARSIGYRQWRQILNRFLKKNETIGARLILELTETSAMTLPEIVIDFMAELQPQGICFALDDFGAGLVSLNFLKDFYLDAIKLSPKVVRGVHADPDAQVVASALMAVARHFDMFVVAPGIEDRKDAEHLTAMGADCLQGFLFGAPTVRPPWVPDVKRAMSARAVSGCS